MDTLKERNMMNETEIVSGGEDILIKDSSSSSSGTSCDEALLGFLYCSSDPLHLTWTLVKIIALSLIIICTVFGNVLVLMAVALSRNLRSSTHYLIVNLAVADLLLGTTVLPFSAASEITGKWYFGQTFCDIWAAVDVLCCTSSILSLCVISLDRYIGVTRPLAYSRIMVGKRTSILIVVIWTASFIISIGPLLGWREPPGDVPYFCSVNKQLGYVFFSATGSFYLPMLVILSVYWKIYKAALRQTKFLESGQKTTKQDVTLRIHMGGTIGGSHKLENRNRAQSAPELALVKINQVRNGNAGGIVMKSGKDQPPLPNPVVSVRPELSSSNSSQNSDGGVGSGNEGHSPPNTSAESGTNSAPVLRAHRGGKRNKALQAQVEYNCNWNCMPQSNGRSNGSSKRQDNNGNSGKVLNNNKTHFHHHHGLLAQAVLEAAGGVRDKVPCDHHHHHICHHKENAEADNNQENVARRPNSLTPSPPSSSPERKQLNANAGFGKIAKFRRQKKAAKTLAIVVGVFLVCWFPFFFVLPLGALCENCIPDWIFNVCFWLGYFNSCLNPVIYACTSREFQRAFRRILCRKGPARPHISRAIYRANINAARFIERDYNGGVHLVADGAVPNGIPMIPVNQWR